MQLDIASFVAPLVAVQEPLENKAEKNTAEIQLHL